MWISTGFFKVQIFCFHTWRKKLLERCSGVLSAMRTAKGEHNFLPKPQTGFAPRLVAFALDFGSELRKKCTASICVQQQFLRVHREATPNAAQCSFCFHHQAGLKQLTWRLEQFLALFGPSGRMRTTKLNLYEPIMSSLYRKHPKSCFFQ